ncbi:MFS transporter [Adhaeribacter aquaticus]|uniref:MFS transporter n=1 Tax=Adhaeribacter aquaticus TaxID=299567 RepID=UPI000403C85B|nr:MFS transporter [Adhaeribacter aquaticus]
MKWTLIVIVISQFFCTSLWFAGNAIMPDLAQYFKVAPAFVAHLTSAVQVGFIAGTLIFATFAISDRYSPSKVFFICALVAALLNTAINLDGIEATGLLLLRFTTGFFLAGIYPIGMKIAADHYQKGLGKSLGFLVGALVLGTAFPHLLRSITTNLPWQYVIYATSAFACLGGAAMFLFVPDGPYRKTTANLKYNTIFKGFYNKPFRAAAFGYFGHMWELYTFWVFVPVIINTYNNQYPEANINVSLVAFCIIASGGIACVCSGLLSETFGAKKVATIALFLSGLCCLISPVFFVQASAGIFIAFLLFWGMVVVADSPLFSTLVAQNAPNEFKGTSLTIVNCIGFAITIISIQLTKVLLSYSNNQYFYMLLALGPLLGLVALVNKK